MIVRLNAFVQIRPADDWTSWPLIPIDACGARTCRRPLAPVIVRDVLSAGVFADRPRGAIHEITVANTLSFSQINLPGPDRETRSTLPLPWRGDTIPDFHGLSTCK
jgi:hypothetical protein